MFTIHLQGIGKRYGAEAVLENVRASLLEGDRIGLVGPNGSGKSTLMRIMAGLEEADIGEVAADGGPRVGYLEQHPSFSEERNVWEEAYSALEHVAKLPQELEDVASQLADCADPVTRKTLEVRLDRLQHEIARTNAYRLDHEVQRVLHGLGFSEETYAQPVTQLSGGQQNRLLLARLLLDAPEVMLLDEPSNHLDIEATEWLEDYLASSSGSFVLVSHDRFLLDKVTGQTWELFQGEIEAYRGNYSAYRRQKAERLEVQRKTYENQQEFIAKTEDFIRRNHYGQKHAQAEDRRKKLERLERVPPPREIRSPPMRFPAASRTGDIVLRVERAAKGFERPLFGDLSFDILRGERWGILGPNGSGKTTLLRCILGEVPLDEGKFHLGTGVQPGYFDQHLESVAEDREVVEAVRPVGKELDEPARRDLLARFGIQGDMAFQRIGTLSGGERNKAALAKLAGSDANFLILDEPTNHLDLWAREALEAALQKFDGTLLFVSHDRFFLNRVADRLLVMEPGGFRVIHGNYDTYRHLASQAASEAPAKSNGAPEKSSGGKSPPKRPAKEKRKRRFPYRKVEDIEEEIIQREAESEDLRDQLCRPEVLRQGDKARELTLRLEELDERIRALYEHWEEATELA